MERVHPLKIGAKIGVLLINLGTPRSPQTGDVAEYLNDFLMDPFVVDIPYLLRWLLVRVLIVPRRSKSSAQLYKHIWTQEGSPLLVHLMKLATEVQRELGNLYRIKPAMRYGNPSIRSALEEFQAESVTELRVLPLYPQFSVAATGSSIAEVRRWARYLRTSFPIAFLPPFYDLEPYLNAVVEVSKPPLEKINFDRVLFSFHGLPERQVRKTDRSGEHCLRAPDCCDKILRINQNCYRAQCFATAKSLADRLKIEPTRYLVCFQSRLGSTPWIQPHTDECYRTLPKQGIKKLAVICPSFVADCLETLEEVRIRGREEFLRNGGEELSLIPSLNSTQVWVKAVSRLITELDSCSGDTRG